MEQKDVGNLVKEKNVKLHRFYFNQAVKRFGVQVQYRAPREGKTYNNNGELDTFFYEPITVGILFEEKPTIWTMRKLGWDTELQTEETLVHVPYDVPKLQAGGILEIPNGLDNAPSRRFRIIKMKTSLIWPSEVTCHIGPLFESNFDRSSLEQRQGGSNFTLLNDEEEN